LAFVPLTYLPTFQDCPSISFSLNVAATSTPTRATSSCRRLFWCSSLCRSRRPPRTPRRALLALVLQFFLPLQILVQPNRQIFDHHILHTEPSLQLRDQF